MRLAQLLAALSAISTVTATILQNGQIRETHYPNTLIDPDSYTWETYEPNATELSYKGRWDSRYISWWSAPGLKFGFSGSSVAITFGQYTSNGTLIAYRTNGEDWQFTNVTTGGTHLLVDPTLDPSVNITYPINPATFELRVTNWEFGVQIQQVHLAAGESLISIPNFDRTIEVIGDSLSCGYTATLEGLSSFAYGVGAGLGNTEYSITAFPGICLYDQPCFGNPHGQVYQWFYTSDTSGRTNGIPGYQPQLWDFSKHPPADIVIINLGTNDANAVNNVSSVHYTSAYIELIEGVHGVWPDAQVILVSIWNGFYADGNTYVQDPAFVSEIYSVYQYFNSPVYLLNPIIYNPVTNSTSHTGRPTPPFVHYFNTTGILQHNDIGPLYHPTDVGHVKVASNLIQYIKLTFGWVLYATGPEVQHDTLYWNNMPGY